MLSSEGFVQYLTRGFREVEDFVVDTTSTLVAAASTVFFGRRDDPRALFSFCTALVALCSRPFSPLCAIPAPPLPVWPV